MRWPWSSKVRPAFEGVQLQTNSPVAEVQLREVTLAEISSLQHTIRVSEANGGGPTEFVVISYTGTYRYGAGGEPDAVYIVAIAEAASRAWEGDAVILDFSGLSYTWGDNMEWALCIGYERFGCDYPLVIVVGDECRAALASLLTDEYSLYCVESLSAAYPLARGKIGQFRDHMGRGREEGRQNDVPNEPQESP